MLDTDLARLYGVETFNLNKNGLLTIPCFS